MKLLILLLAALTTTLQATEPLMLTKGKLLYSEDFAKLKEVTQPRYWPGQGTRWSVNGGVLVGIAASAEYQKERHEIGHHFGDVPRIGIRQMPKSYIMSFKFQVDDKPGDAKVPLIEFGHHVTRLYFGSEGAALLSIGEKKTLDEAQGYKLTPLAWYEIYAEIGEEDVLIRLTDPKGKVTKFYGHEPEFKNAKNMNFGMATTKQGTAKMDEIKCWEAKGIRPGFKK